MEGTGKRVLRSRRMTRTSHTLQRMFVLSVTQAAMESFTSHLIFALRNTLVSMEDEADWEREERPIEKAG